jgi:hypothetical protein
MQIRRTCSKLIAGAIILSGLTAPVFSQTAATSTKDTGNRSDVSLLKQEIAEQQQQIEQLRKIVEEMKQRQDQSTAPAQTAAVNAPNLGQVASATPMVPKGDSKAVTASSAADLHSMAASAAAPSLNASASARALNGQATEETPKSSPLSFRIGDSEFTPGGFMDFTEFFRSTDLGSGIGTSFGSLPFSVTGGTVNPAARLSESRFSNQNSRLSMKVTSQVGENKVTGYVEADFLGNAANSIFQTSNSDTLRMRLYWVDLLRGKWEVLGGQSWSMMTPGRDGISANPSNIFYSQDMDTNYQVGLTWARQPQFRIVYHPNKEWAIGLSLENSEQFLTTAVALPGGSSGTYASQFDIGGNQISTPNLMPDIAAKVAYDPTIGGKHLHAELGGVLRAFRDYASTTNTKNSNEGGALEGGLNLEAVKDLHFIVNGFYGAGGGRYIYGLGPDVVVKPDGSIATVRSGSGIAGFEFQVNKKTMLYAYYGGAYFDNAYYVSSVSGAGVPTYVGFGYPGSSNTSNRVLQEGTVGFVQTFWKNPKYGALQWINQVSYVERAPWYIPSGTSKNAHLDMVYTDLRYVLP